MLPLKSFRNWDYRRKYAGCTLTLDFPGEGPVPAHQLKKEYLSSVEKIKRQIQPEKRRLQRELIDMKTRSRQTQILVRDIDRDIKEINALLEKKDVLDLTQEEIQTWEQRLAALIKKREVLSSEKVKLTQDIEAAKMKDKVLNL